jgi:oligopeptide transport system substrate-binding protein
VRRALALATDRENLVNTVYEGKPHPATGGFLPPGMPGYSEGIALPYDPPEARRLLAEAGYSGGHGFPEVEFLLSERPTTRKFKEYLQAQWQKNLGIKINWNILSWEAFLEQVHLKKPHLWAMGQFANHPDPHELLQSSSVSMGTGWSNEGYEEKVTLAREAMDQEKRLRLYQRADRILVDQVPILPIDYARFTILVKPWVRRYPLSPTRGWFWKEVIIEPHSS